MAGSNGLRMALGAGAAVTIFGVAVVVEPLLRPRDRAPLVDPVIVAPDAELPNVEVATVAPDPVTPAGVQPDPVAPPIAPPVIDVVRIAPDGTGIVAGQAPAGTLVTVMLGDDMVAEAVADASGSFAAFVTLPLSDQPRTLSLVADPTGAAVVSEATVIVAPNPVIAPAPIAVADPLPPAAVEPVEEVAATSPQGPDSVAVDLLPGVAAEPPTDVPAEVAIAPLPAAAPPAAAPTQATDVAIAQAEPSLPIVAPVEPSVPSQAGQTLASTTPATVLTAPDPAPDILDSVAGLAPPAPEIPGIAPVLRMDESGVRILQPAIAPGATPEVLTTVALDAIAYDPAGDVQLSGRAAGGGTVRVYVDNRVIVEVPVGADGQWTSGLPDVPTGVYTMRVDQLDAAGAVVSRIETPFLREERATIAAAMVDQTAAPDFTVAVKTVQPGATLWAIARERYGDGVLYVQVFEANRDRIRNPDLIYPGQVFVLPELPQQ